jgi:tetratricopeptide (TPR) repeat protein
MAEITSPKLQQLFQMLEREPDDTFLLYGIGMEYKKLAAPKKAIEYFDRVIQNDSGYSYAYFQRGQVLEQIGETEKAKQAYRDGMAAANRVGDAHAQSELQAALEMIE